MSYIENTNAIPYMIVARDYGIGDLGQYGRYLLNGIVRNHFAQHFRTTVA